MVRTRSMVARPDPDRAASPGAAPVRGGNIRGRTQVDVAISVLASLAAQQPQLDEREDQNGDQQRDRHRRAIADLVGRPKDVGPYAVDDRQRRRPRTAFGQDQRRIEDLQPEDRGDHDGEEDHLTEQRQGQPVEALPAVRPVQFGRLIAPAADR